MEVSELAGSTAASTFTITLRHSTSTITSFPSKKLLIITLCSSFKWLYPKVVVTVSQIVSISRKEIAIGKSMIKLRSSYAVITNNAI